MEFVPARDAAQWDEVVLAQPTATPFHAWAFLDSYARSAGLTFEPSLVLRDGEAIGGVSSLVRTRGPLRWVNIGLSFAYAGPAVATGDLDEVLEAQSHRARLTTMRERVEARTDPAGVTTQGWSATEGATMAVTLAGRTEDELRSAASKKFRQHLGHATRGGLVVEPADDADFTLLEDWVRERFALQQLASVWTADLMREVCADAAARGALHLDVATFEGATVGVQVSLSHGDRTYPWLIGSATAHEHLRIPTALSWSLLTWARAAGYAEVDLSGAPTKGIREFKRSMGAQPQPYLILNRGLRA